LAGFGVINITSAPDTGVLRYVEQVRVHDLDSETSGRNFLPVAETMDVSQITSMSSPKGACPGDSGGPAFASNKTHELTLLGILSLGETGRFSPSSAAYCLGHAPGSISTVGNIFTDVRAYAAWISEIKDRFSTDKINRPSPVVSPAVAW
jgi:secreted trypsin-like serine protease